MGCGRPASRAHAWDTVLSMATEAYRAGTMRAEERQARVMGEQRQSQRAMVCMATVNKKEGSTLVPQEMKGTIQVQKRLQE